MNRSDTLGKIAPALVERYEPDPNSGCWLWLGSIGTGGYGTVSIGGRNFKAHRISWAVHMGFLPPPIWKVCHRCDTPSCVNPAHLWLGTQQDNVADMNAKGRGVPPKPRYGSTNNQASLTEEQVGAIRQALRDGAVQADLYREYRVSPMTISRIARGESWRHVS